MEKVVKGDIDCDSIEERDEIDKEGEDENPYGFAECGEHQHDVLACAYAAVEGDLRIVASVDFAHDGGDEKSHHHRRYCSREQNCQYGAKNREQDACDIVKEGARGDGGQPVVLLGKLRNVWGVDGVRILGEGAEHIQDFGNRAVKEHPKENEGDKKRREGDEQELLGQEVFERCKKNRFLHLQPLCYNCEKIQG